MAPLVLTLLLHFSIALSSASPDHESSGATTIIFATLGSRSTYAFDIFTLPTRASPSSADEIQLTDGKSLNFNGFFPSLSSSLLSLLPNQTLIQTLGPQNSAPLSVVYVTERGGSSNIFYDLVYLNSLQISRSRSALEIPKRVQVPLLKGKNGIAMKDKPTVTGDYLIYVSTHEDPGKPRASWAAVYSTELKTGLTRRLTPYGIADFSPAVSPSGVYTAVASYGESGWNGDVEELSTDIYVFLTRDGTQRVKVVEHGGWPSWVDDTTLYFHRRSEEDEWISVYRAILPSGAPISTDSVIVERVTPPGLHAFTPATSADNNKFIAVATRRPDSDYRHIELYDLVKNEFIELTRLLSPQTHHLNPFISPDSTRVGYHRCRGASNDKKSAHFLLENLNSPVSEISLFRVDGSFPSWSPGGDRIAYVEFPGIYVVNPDGSNRRQVYPKMAFSTVWDPVRPGVVYSSTGPTFASESTEVDIISINVDGEADEAYNFKKLTTNGENNAFPAVSPDGKWVVFRSGRSGHKNLYVMDAVEGEKAGLRRLTEGPWGDTMCSWSPDGEWIAFASDRENPGSGSFELFLIHPNGTGLRKLVQSGLGGRTNHPYFSPDGKSIAFTTDYAGISAEPISNPHHYQPYGEIYTVKLDGSDLKRLTHNSFEDGTPAWGPTYIKPEDVEWPIYRPKCSFEECHWLNEMPSHSGGVETLEPSKPQCSGA
ncbi:hypothetical protein P3X46_021403 [Hevea brasiliensis]|uniref:Dipeptidylpeptidase IV N-terminal domain-containing protein n=1 Tax=Hevea brasiliensis TaxID=3981 RepID=A0ABQ9LHB2_HEVBR|nr:uncharacterized protein LOC110655336 [Hevea brasiliensis]KAJ9166693.1 hypothetical protein P3X46_021403 [Hevea brasiliensis]